MREEDGSPVPTLKSPLDFSSIAVGVYKLVAHPEDLSEFCKAMDVAEDTLDDDIVLADIDTTGHGKILAPLFLGPSCEPTWHSFHTKHPVKTSYSDEIKTFTITSWDKKMLQVEITKFRKMEEVLTVLFTFSGQSAAQTLTKVKPVGHIFAKKSPQNKICFQYEWEKSLQRK
jgi:hypothetical protein